MVLVAALFIIGCILPSFSAAPVPTQPALSMDKLGTIIALTAHAAQTQTATFLPTSTNTFLPTQVLFPTFTLAPTGTPLILVTITQTATPGMLVVGTDGTLVSVTPAPTHNSASTPSSGGKPTKTEKPDGGAVIRTPAPWECKVIEKSPAKGAIIKKGTQFYASWTVLNSGTKVWPDYGIDFVYMSGYGTDGRKIQDLSTTISPGGTITLRVPFTAPKNEDVYNIFWSLRVGNTYFCPMKISFEVKS
jgi:hypothetical protein